MGIRSNMLRITALTASLASTFALETYEFPQNHNPYHYFPNWVDPNVIPQKLHVRQSDTVPIEGHVIFPNVTGKYPWVDFQHGFLGEFPEIVYSELIHVLVNLGFAVSYGMPHKSNPHEFTPADNFTAWQTWNTWVKENINDVIQESLDTGDLVVDVEVDTDKLGLMCHADGCDMTKEFMIQNPSLAEAFFFFDPVYSYDNVDTKVNLPGRQQSVVVAQSDMCARCCEASENFDRRTFDSISGMDIKTYQKIANTGHCSAFNYWFLDNCRKGRYCEMPRMQMNEARNFHRDVAGWLTSLMTHSFFNRRDMVKYFTDASKMPNNFLVNNEIVCEGKSC